MLEVGERAPDFVLPSADGTPTRFYGQAGGRPTAIVLAPADSSAGRDLSAAIAARGDLAVYWIADGAASIPEGAAGFVDAGGAVSARYGGGAAVVCLDANLRVTATASALDVVAVVAELDRAAYADAGVRIESQAPMLMIPRVLDATLCDELIAQCRSASVETGVEQTAGTTRQAALDATYKRRRDLTVTAGEQLQALSAAVGRRVLPEVQRAFAFRATRFEGFKVAWYDESARGFFAPHRDNLTPATAHRVFGLSINLNDDYTGGELAFPEYGDQRYRAPRGAAMVFSCDLLHAVRPVEEGARFVLLSFLYAER
ncbi:MAG: hypothetical protein ABIM89_17135 [Mycobacteriales bacterium]